MRYTVRSLVAIAFMLVFLLPSPALAADAVVQPPCNEAAFDAAFNSVQASGGGTITFNCGGPATIPFTNQKLLLADTVLDGGGQITLSGADKTRLFFVNTGLSLTLRSLTLRDGFAAVGGGLIETFGGKIQLEEARLLDSQATTTGGALNCSLDNQAGEMTIQDSQLEGHTAQNGGAIYSGGCQLTITDSRLIKNRAVPDGDKFGEGGAVYLDPQSQLQVQDTLFDQNEGYAGGALFISRGAGATLTRATLDRSQAAYGGAIHNEGNLSFQESLLDRSQATAEGGGIWNFAGSVSLEYSALRRGSAQQGGGLLTYGGPVNLLAVTVDGNTASDAGGGGIYFAGGNMVITESTISNNTASGADSDGGGIWQWSDGDLTMTNVTLANNQAPNGLGGGLYHRSRKASLTYVTFSGNRASIGQHIGEDPLAGASLTLEASALAGQGAACAAPPYSVILSNGYNRIEGTCDRLMAQTTDKLQAGDLGLMPLGNNGGPTFTLLPSASSQLVDAIPLADCPPVAGGDQRYKLRPSGGGCDVGTVERQPTDDRVFLYVPLVNR